jgi:hypothetical protein
MWRRTHLLDALNRKSDHVQGVRMCSRVGKRLVYFLEPSEESQHAETDEPGAQATLLPA